MFQMNKSEYLRNPSKAIEIHLQIFFKMLSLTKNKTKNDNFVPSSVIVHKTVDIL